MQEVVRHLIDEVRSCGLAVDAGPLQVALAEIPQRVLIEGRQNLCIAAQIGIVGATTESLPLISSPRNTIVNPVAAAVQSEINLLTSNGVKIIIVSTHLQGLASELALIPLLTNVDAVIAGGGSEFRNNDEMTGKWFRPDGSVDHLKLQSAKDVYDLITPSKERALALNKAYRTIVEDQDFIFGKDPVLSPPVNVYEKIDNENTPTLPPERIFKWNIVLDWPE
jgi:hypothetical protein